ncbi:MAG: hypothetical protein K2W78_15120 [Xanthobacteraceae bacterium]|nr:hypothetical protein [Xanthobacteraceae bacterium]
MNAKRSKPKTKPQAKPKKPREPKPFEDAPFWVDPSDDGDMATPKPELDEQELKEQEERQ